MPTPPFPFVSHAQVVRVGHEATRTCLRRLGGAAEYLLGDFRTREEKTRDFGQMRKHEEGVVSGYAGGGNYGSDQFLETRGAGNGEVVPAVGADVAPAVVEGRVSAFPGKESSGDPFCPGGLCLRCFRFVGAVGEEGGGLVSIVAPFLKFHTPASKCTKYLLQFTCDIFAPLAPTALLIWFARRDRPLLPRSPSRPRLFSSTLLSSLPSFPARLLVLSVSLCLRLYGQLQDQK